MIFRQLFDATSGTYTYLIASRHGGEALIIDPVLDKYWHNRLLPLRPDVQIAYPRLAGSDRLAIAAETRQPPAHVEQGEFVVERCFFHIRLPRARFHSSLG